MYINVCGLKSKLRCPEFTSLINDHDIVCVQESKLDDIDQIEITDYTVFTNNRKRITRYRSGGIALIIRNKLLPYIKVLQNESKLVSWFLISKDLTMNNEDLYCGAIYIPPNRSKYAHEDPYLEIQHEIDRICSNSRNILLCGDFNSRTSTLDDFVHIDNFMGDMFGNFDLINENREIMHCLERNNISLNRLNDDKTTNTYGWL